ncbi:MAG: hypothetical protein ABEH43_08525 [Flavobacteriales bacterium]
MKKIFTLFVISLSIFICVPELYAGPLKATELAVQIRQKPISKHWKIYEKILADTSLLESEPLKRALIQTGIENWYGKLIRGTQLGYVEQEVLPNKAVNRSFGDFWQVVSKLEADRRTIECWVKILSAPPITLKTPRIKMKKKLKASGPRFLSFLMMNVKYKNTNKNEKNRNEEFRILTNCAQIPDVTYETIRLHWNDLSPELKSKITDFSWDVLQEKKVLGGWKQFATTFLYNIKNVPKQEIKKELFIPDREDGPSGDYVEQLHMRDIEVWENEYPRWPVDGSKTDDDPHKNERGKGHDKRKGKGH